MISIYHISHDLDARMWTPQQLLLGENSIDNYRADPSDIDDIFTRLSDGIQIYRSVPILSESKAFF